uniref:Uncharacterized protein n=1 Tax=Branchiostoma floridae TaxID=7739 RepID=C3Y9X9_BRAFL|eukprot:XP_002606878.1 hypothetical protein BRAFLDRAFT_91647 [Branchiostoma floridae]
MVLLQGPHAAPKIDPFLSYLKLLAPPSPCSHTVTSSPCPACPEDRTPVFTTSVRQNARTRTQPGSEESEAWTRNFDPSWVSLLQTAPKIDQKKLKLDCLSDPQSVLYETSSLMPGVKQSSHRVYTGTIARVYTGIIVRVYTGPLVKVYTGPLVKVYTGSLVRVYAGSLVRVYTGPLVRVYTESSRSLKEFERRAALPALSAYLSSETMCLGGTASKSKSEAPLSSSSYVITHEFDLGADDC